MGNLCTLDSVSVPELSLRLTGNDLVAMRPYPNKQYPVGMLKGRRALNGFFWSKVPVRLKSLRWCPSGISKDSAK
uniref:DUF6012 family protein n=1 Tax=Escherichia coli TaxID=562 RepID=UPI001F24C07F|nr:DUF6012 family protein [Escherichia coli]UGK56826.1 hypothetical protein [Escherichia coli]